MEIVFSKQAWKTFIDDLTHEELEFIKEGICEPCKGDIWFWDSDCRYDCEGFRDEALQCIEAGLKG